MPKLYKKFVESFNNWVYAGLALVVSTTSPSPTSANGLPGIDITIGGLVTILFDLACYATKVIEIIMVLIIVWYGLKMMLAQGSDVKFTAARKSLNYAIVGLLVILGANTIIATVGNTIAAVGQQDLSTRSSQFINYTPLGSCSY